MQTTDPMIRQQVLNAMGSLLNAPNMKPEAYQTLYRLWTDFQDPRREPTTFETIWIASLMGEHASNVLGQRVAHGLMGASIF